MSVPAPRSRSLSVAWVVTFFVLAAGVAGVVTWREAVVRAWPASGRILGNANNFGTDPVPQAQKPAGKSVETTREKPTERHPP